MSKKAKETNYADLTKRALLQSYAPASVVTDVKGNILFVHGDTGKYLRAAPGQATLNVIEMAREGLQLELRAALLLVAGNTEYANKGVPFKDSEVSVKTNNHVQLVRLGVRPLPTQENGEKLLLVSFQDVSLPAAPNDKLSHEADEPGPHQLVEELTRELAYTKENLQATIEEQQASNEELKSTNEELQSTNEELQSTNEELETSKEELQSVNEEMVSVNAELQAKIEQLAGMQNDMKNFLDNINVGTIFLDDHLTIRRYTRDATALFRLVATDIGRPLSDIKSDVEGVDLLANAQIVLDTLVPWERELKTVGGAWYLARIQCYRTLDNVIDGVVLTFTDISQRIKAETEKRSAMILSESIVNTVREPLLVLDGTLRVIYASNAFYRLFQVAPENTVGNLLYELGNHQWDIPALRELLKNIFLHDQSLEGYLVENNFPVIGQHKLLLNARRIIDQTGNTQQILLAMEAVQQV